MPKMLDRVIVAEVSRGGEGRRKGMQISELMVGGGRVLPSTDVVGQFWCLPSGGEWWCVELTLRPAWVKPKVAAMMIRGMRGRWAPTTV